MQLRNKKITKPLPKKTRTIQPDDDTDIEEEREPQPRRILEYGDKMKVFDRRGVYVPYVNHTWAIDLIDMTKQEAGYILNVVDIFSRKAESEKLNSKSSEALKNGLLKIFEKFDGKPKKIWTDMESGIYGLYKWFEDNNIEIYSLNNSYLGPTTHSSPIVERFNREMKRYMLKLKSKNPKQNYNQLMHRTVREFIPIYNEKKHSTIKATPNEVYNGDEPIYKTKQTHLRNVNRPRVSLKPFKVGTTVLLQKPFKEKIEGKTEVKYYEEPFKIIQVKLTNPITYILDGIDGTFYRNQLKKID